MDDMVLVVMAYSAHRLLFESDDQGNTFEGKDVWIRNFDPLVESRVALMVQYLSCEGTTDPIAGREQWINFASSVDEETSSGVKSSEGITELAAVAESERAAKETKELAVTEEGATAKRANEAAAAGKPAEEAAAARSLLDEENSPGEKSSERITELTAVSESEGAAKETKELGVTEEAAANKGANEAAAAGKPAEEAAAEAEEGDEEPKEDKNDVNLEGTEDEDDPSLVNLFFSSPFPYCDS